MVKLRDTVVGENEVSFGAGCIYSDLLIAVDAAGKALPNLPSLPHINVVGSMVTTTHGSGYKQQALIAHVQNFDIILADGSLKTVHKDDPNFYLYIHSFGGVGIITRMSMTVVPRFHVFKSIYKNLSWDAIADDAVFDQLERSSDYLSLFNNWEKREFTSVWRGIKYYEHEECPEHVEVIHGAQHILEERIHPVIGRDSLPCVTVGKGSWREKLYHFRPDAPPSSAGDEIQSEFYVAYNDFRNVMDELYKYRHAFKHLV